MQLALTTPVKDKYKLRNWKNYNKNLCHRGSLSLYISDSVLREWRDVDKCKKVVGEKTYTESIILCCLLLKMQYSQPLRQTTGFVKSLLSLAGCRDFSIPDYTTLCRRQGCVPMSLTKRWESGEKLALAVDSTGLKVYGEAIIGANIVKDFFAGISDIVGGRSGAYEQSLREAKGLAIKEMIEQAERLGANAIIGVDLDYESHNGSMLMVSANGTAVVYE